MTWFRVDDSFTDHPKVKRIPRADRAAAIGLWTLAGAWSARHLQDGVVPDYMIEELAGTDELAKLLVDVGLWHIVEGGYLVHDWEKWQPTREAVESRRQSEADRKAKWRQSRQDKGKRPEDVPPGQDADSARDTSGTDAFATLSRPDPTRPDPTSSKSTSSVADAPAKKPAARKTKMPAGWWPTDDMARWAREQLGPSADLKDLTENFIDHHAAKGTLFVDWNRAWQTWVRNDRRFHGSREVSAPSHIWNAS